MSTASGDWGAGDGASTSGASTSGASAAGASAAGSSTSAQNDLEGESLGTMVSKLTNDLSRLMRQEMELAKTEIKEEVAKAGKGAGMLGGAGFAGYMAVLFLSLTLMWALSNIMDVAWAALIVTILWAVVAAVLFVLGRSTLKAVNPKPEKTVQTLKEDAEWVKQQRS